jgi:hypothetical protein
MASIAESWFGAFMETMKTHEASTILREGMDSGEMKHWTEALTGIVVCTFANMRWHGAERGHRSYLLPVPRSKFSRQRLRAGEQPRRRHGRLLALESPLRAREPTSGVCFRRDASGGAELMGHFADQVTQAMEIPMRTGLGGETLVIVGSRSERLLFLTAS